MDVEMASHLFEKNFSGIVADELQKAVEFFRAGKGRPVLIVL